METNIAKGAREKILQRLNEKISPPPTPTRITHTHYYHVFVVVWLLLLLLVVVVVVDDEDVIVGVLEAPCTYHTRTHKLVYICMRRYTCAHRHISLLLYTRGSYNIVHTWEREDLLGLFVTA